MLFKKKYPQQTYVEGATNEQNTSNLSKLPLHTEEKKKFQKFQPLTNITNHDSFSESTKAMIKLLNSFIFRPRIWSGFAFDGCGISRRPIHPATFLTEEILNLQKIQIQFAQYANKFFTLSPNDPALSERLMSTVARKKNELLNFIFGITKDAYITHNNDDHTINTSLTLMLLNFCMSLNEFIIAITKRTKKQEIDIYLDHIGNKNQQIILDDYPTMDVLQCCIDQLLVEKNEAAAKWLIETLYEEAWENLMLQELTIAPKIDVFKKDINELKRRLFAEDYFSFHLYKQGRHYPFETDISVIEKEERLYRFFLLGVYHFFELNKLSKADFKALVANNNLNKIQKILEDANNLPIYNIAELLPRVFHDHEEHPCLQNLIIHSPFQELLAYIKKKLNGSSSPFWNKTSPQSFDPDLPKQSRQSSENSAFKLSK